MASEERVCHGVVYQCAIKMDAAKLPILEYDASLADGIGLRADLLVVIKKPQLGIQRIQKESLNTVIAPPVSAHGSQTFAIRLGTVKLSSTPAMSRSDPSEFKYMRVSMFG